MIAIVEALENVESGKECIVTFNNGNVVGLKDFEGVDESIYSRNDLIVADVVSQIKCDKKFSKPGTTLQFSFKDIAKINGIDIQIWAKHQLSV